jgi:hypothetical protein
MCVYVVCVVVCVCGVYVYVVCVCVCMCFVCVLNAPYSISVGCLSALDCSRLCVVVVYMYTVYSRL